MAATRLRDKFPVPPIEQVALATVLRTVGEPIRLEMVRLLADGQARSCGEITDALGLPASTGSYHMKLLREAGLTSVRPAGTERRISLRREELEERFPGLVDVLVRDRDG